MIAFTVYGKAQPAGSKRAFVNKRTGKAIVTDDNARSRPWKQEVASVAYRVWREANEGDMFAPLMTGPLYLRVDFYFARPKGHYGTGRNADRLKASAPEFPTGRPDCTKLLRGLEDALTGVLWRDDAQVVYQAVRKFYGEPERAVVSVSTIAGGVYGLGREAA